MSNTITGALVLAVGIFIGIQFGKQMKKER